LTAVPGILSLIIIFFQILWLGVLSFFLYRYIKHYNLLTENTNKSDLVKILETILASQDIHRDNLEKLSKTVENIKKEDVLHLQKTGLIRFNPFNDSGGDQSFVFALLDGEDNGVVITSLNNRGVARWYAKTVVKGVGADHKLSDEEIKAINLAIKNRIKELKN
jgi:hypothetical protein